MQSQLASLRNDLYLVYQPIVRRITTRETEMTEFEVLLRTKRNHRYPGDFMDFLISSENRNRQLLEWYSEEMIRIIQKHPTYRFDINIHPQQLTHPSTWVFLESLLEWKDRIQIEMTEKPFQQSCTETSDDHSLCNQIKAIQKLGYRISLDDVGSGINTLELIADRMTGVSTLKFSIHNFRRISPEVLKHFIIAWRIFADSYGLRIVVEGIESQFVADYLFSNGIEWQQGYYWAEKIDL